jgi:hypothetical protein
MSTHLQRFIDRVRGFEARGAKDFNMSMTDAKDLHADITRLLIDLNTLREAAIITHTQDSVVTVEIDGGTFR